jgi:hypothetical protein
MKKYLPVIRSPATVKVRVPTPPPVHVTFRRFGVVTADPDAAPCTVCPATLADHVPTS